MEDWVEIFRGDPGEVERLRASLADEGCAARTRVLPVAGLVVCLEVATPQVSAAKRALGLDRPDVSLHGGLPLATLRMPRAWRRNAMRLCPVLVAAIVSFLWWQSREVPAPFEQAALEASRKSWEAAWAILRETPLYVDPYPTVWNEGLFVYARPRSTNSRQIRVCDVAERVNEGRVFYDGIAVKVWFGARQFRDVCDGSLKAAPARFEEK